MRIMNACGVGKGVWQWNEVSFVLFLFFPLPIIMLKNINKDGILWERNFWGAWIPAGKMLLDWAGCRKGGMER